MQALGVSPAGSSAMLRVRIAPKPGRLHGLTHSCSTFGPGLLKHKTEVCFSAIMRSIRTWYRWKGVAQTARQDVQGNRLMLAREGQGNPRLSQKAQGSSRGNSRGRCEHRLGEPLENREGWSYWWNEESSQNSVNQKCCAERFCKERKQEIGTSLGREGHTGCPCATKLQCEGPLTFV